MQLVGLQYLLLLSAVGRRTESCSCWPDRTGPLLIADRWRCYACIIRRHNLIYRRGNCICIGQRKWLRRGPGSSIYQLLPPRTPPLPDSKLLQDPSVDPKKSSEKSRTKILIAPNMQQSWGGGLRVPGKLLRCVVSCGISLKANAG